MTSRFHALREYCETTRQKEVFDSLVTTQNITRTALHVGGTRQAMQSVIAAVEKRARLRGWDPSMDLTHPAGAGLNLKRVSTNYNSDGDINQQWVIYEPEKEAQDLAYRAYIEGLMQNLKPVKATKPNKLDYTSELASAIVFGDAHLGMIAHAVETLGAEHDLDTALADIKSAIDYLVDCSPAQEEGYFINVGDFTHTNDFSNTTPGHGNMMDVGQRHSQTMRAAGAIIRYCISRMLTKFKTVRVINARGNHDYDAAFALNMFLEGIYEDEPRVEVLQNDSKFNFIEFGNTLIGVNHGDKINALRLAGVMTRMQSEAWGRTKYRRWFLGHIHHKVVQEHETGVTLESFHTLAPIDAWHAESGYGAESRVTMITFHREFGEVNRMSPSLDMLRALR